MIFEIKFAEHLIETLSAVGSISREQAILVILDLIDMVLIANLVVMVVISGYETFISPLHLAEARFMLITQVVFIATAAAFVLFNWLEHGPETKRGPGGEDAD